MSVRAIRHNCRYLYIFSMQWCSMIKCVTKKVMVARRLDKCLDNKKQMGSFLILSYHNWKEKENFLLKDSIAMSTL